MLTVTQKAAAVLQRTLDENVDEGSERVLRLSSSENGLAISIDEEREGDQVVTHDERKVLVIEGGLAEALTGITVDSIDTPEGERLVLQEPEAGDETAAPA